MTTRRDFLWKTAASAGLLAGGFPAISATKKTLLILGGTRFLGPEIVDAAKASGWTITLFNRGKTNPGLFPELEKLQGDRNGDLKSLEGRVFDAVIDTSGYVPRQVRDSAALLGKSAKQYVFVSSVSVYADLRVPGVDETGPVAILKDPAVEKVTEETYGGLKALCEKAAEAAMPGRVTNVRPGLIVGPNDGTDRFTYWPVRVANGGDARFTWVDAAFLAAQKVEEWSDLPVWTSPAGSDAGVGRVSNARAAAKGLAFRPVKATAKDTLDWWKTLPRERTSKLKSGFSPQREAAVLAAWHEARAKKPPKAG